MATDLVIRFLGDTKEFNAKLAETQRKIGQVGESSKTAGQKISSGIKMAGLAIGGAAIAVGVASVEMADKYEVAHARLDTALKNTGTSFDAVKGHVDELTKRGVTFGLTATDVEGALAIMTTGMGSAAAAMKNLQLAEDLSAQTGKPLAEAAIAVTKASEGQLRPLKQLGIDLPIAAAGAVKVQKAQGGLQKALQAAALVETKIKDGRLKGAAAQDAYRKATDNIAAAQKKLNDTQGAGQSILDALSTKLGGAASAQAETFGGKIKALKAQITDWGIQIGNWLIPKIQTLVDWLQSTTTWLGKHQEAAKVLAGIITGVLIGAIVLYTANMVAAAAATIAATWPILAVIAVIGLLVAAAVILYDHWDTIWSAIKDSPAYPIIKLLLTQVRLEIDAVKIAIQWFKDNWPQIWQTIQDAVKPAADAMMTALGPVHRMLKDMGDAASTLAGIIDHIPGVGGSQKWNPAVQGVGNGGHGAPGGNKPVAPSGNNWYAPGNPGNPGSGSSSPVHMAANGGTFRGPQSGYLVMLHGTEKVTKIRPGSSGEPVHIEVNVVNATGNAREIGASVAEALRNGFSRAEIRRLLGVV